MKKAEYIERYGEEAYLKRSIKNKQYYEDNKEKFKRRSKEWRILNPDKAKAKEDRWRKANPEKHRAIKLIAKYNKRDKEKGFDTSNNINFNWFLDNIYGSKCIYCNDSNWKHLGVDRIDNNKPHTPDNCVCSCWLCNAQREDKYTVEEFKAYRLKNPRECDIPKQPQIKLKNGAIIKKEIN